jgi:uncharacterized protein YbaR (Trm112 family)
MLDVLCPNCTHALKYDDGRDRFEYAVCDKCATPVTISNRREADEYWSKKTQQLDDDIQPGEFYCDHCPLDFLDISLETPTCTGCRYRDKVKKEDSATFDLRNFIAVMLPKQQLQVNW